MTHVPVLATSGRPAYTGDSGRPAAQRSDDAGPGAPAGRPHLLAIALEDYYHNFGEFIDRAHWPRFERRIEQGTHRVLDLLDEVGARATFFALGWVADTLPELVQEVARRGHEIASKGYDQRPAAAMSTGELRDDLARAREALERASGAPVLGYRAPGWLAPGDHARVAALLVEDGYAYSASVKPFLRAFGDDRWAGPRRLEFDAGPLWEVPVSGVRLGGLALPVGAGNYTRQLPPRLMRAVVSRWDLANTAPLFLNFHTWEFDPGQPEISAAPLLARVRYYRNTARLPELLRWYLRRHTFMGVGAYLSEHLADPLVATRARARAGGAAAPGRAPSPSWAAAAATGPAPARAASVPVTLVVPCYNEERALPYLANTLESVARELAPRYAVEIVLVDDASTDATPDVLRRHFGDRPGCTIVRHARNRGVAQAILTGARAAQTDVVASIDCDCTYDPHELGRLLPLLADGVDVVTGSPYHPLGGVRNVPRWRLALSRSASALYRVVLRQRLHTYTSCFRAYRRSALLGLEIRHDGFLGVAEMLARLDLAGRTVVEYPTTLNVRVLGRSKMRVARTIFGHLRLVGELVAERARHPGPARPAGAPAAGAQRAAARGAR